MKLIAKKPCSFGGKKFYIGDTIPNDCIINPKDHEKQGTIAIVGDADGAPVTATTPIPRSYIIRTEAGELNVSNEAMQSVFDVLLGKVGEVETIVDTMTDGDALILLHQAETRKAVKTAIEARAKALEDGEQ